MRIPINTGRQERAEEIAQQDAIHYGTGLETPAHPISEVRPEENRATQTGQDSSGSYGRGKEMSGDPDIATQSITDDAARGEVQVGPVGTEVGGTSGGATTGGDLTPHEDAGEAMDDVKRNLEESADIERQQQQGLIEEQREDLKPSVNNPEEGTPANPDGKENSGGANPQEYNPQGGSSDAAASAAAPSEATVNRAAAEHDERFLRLAADFENYKRAVARRETEVRERAARSVLEDFLPVLDNFDRAVQASKSVSGDPAVRNLVMGVQGILMQMEGALRSHGVQPMETKGQKFDPLLHEAIEAVEGSGQPEGTVVGEAQRGYTFNGAVLRPATVRVAA